MLFRRFQAITPFNPMCPFSPMCAFSPGALVDLGLKLGNSLDFRDQQASLRQRETQNCDQAAFFLDKPASPAVSLYLRPGAAMTMVGTLFLLGSRSYCPGLPPVLLLAVFIA